MNRAPARRVRTAAATLLLASLAYLPGYAWGQITTLPRADSSSGDFFGNAVAIHGDRILVGATGIDRCGENSGAAYVYRRGGDVDGWEQEAVLEPGDCVSGAFFGRSVALSEDVAVVAASREFFSRETPNAVYVYELDESDGAWRQTAKLTGGLAAGEGSFATSVAIDGHRILVTSSGDPAGRRSDGSAYLFERDASTGEWVRRYRLSGSGTTDRGVFGTSGALSGEVAAITASTYFRNRPGSLFIFESDADGTWTEAARFGGIEDFFIAVGADGDRVVVGQSKARRGESGSATVFEREGERGWMAAQSLRPSKPYDAGAFGSSVAIHGEYVLVVGFDEQLGLDINIDRVVFVFKHDAATDSWHQHHVIDVGEVSFGADVALHEGYAVIGSASDGKPGSAYVVRLPE